MTNTTSLAGLDLPTSYGDLMLYLLSVNLFFGMVANPNFWLKDSPSNFLWKWNWKEQEFCGRFL